jgi:predicted component of type VI protein secretion system
VARIIVASPDRIAQKLDLNLRGLPLQLVAVPPPAIPRRRNTWYYQLDTRGSTAEAQRDWEAIVASRSLAIDIPREILAAQFELLGLEGGS